MTIQQILDLLKQQSGGGGGTASVPAAALAGGGGGSNSPGGLLSSLSGFGGAPTGGTTGNVEGGINTALRAGSLIPGPQQPIVAILAAVAPFIEQLFGGGVPREAKTEAVGQAAAASGDPINALLGQYINQGAQGGHVLSESGGRNFELGTERMAALLEALTGHQSPNVTTNAGFQNNPNLNLPQLGDLSGFKLPQGYQFLDPSNAKGLNQAFQDIQQLQGSGATDIFGKGAQGEWQKLINELISQGVLTKYSGSLGAVGGSNVGATGTTPAGGSGSIPNVMLPHPLAPNPANSAPSPYPV